METGPKKDKESKKTDKKRAAEVLSSATFAVDRKGTAEVLKPRRASKLDRAIADLAVPRPEITDKPKKPSGDTPERIPDSDATGTSESAADTKPAEADQSHHSEHTSQAENKDIPADVNLKNETHDDETDTPDKNETNIDDTPEQRELSSPKTLYAGEVILNLHDDDSVQEDEIPLNLVSSEAGPVAPENDSEDEPDDPVQPTPTPPVVWRSQPQQQHQQRQYNRPMPPQPTPPVTPPVSPNRPTPPGPNNPNLPPPFPSASNYNVQPAMPPQPPVEVLNPNDPNSLVTRREMENEVYYAQKAAQNKGVLAGLIVGGGYEHFKHRRREKKQERVMREQDRKLKRSLESNTFLQTETDRLRANHQESAPGSAHVAPDKRPTTNEKHSLKKRFEKNDTNQLEVPPEHHIETSAWHSIEVDNKTGKAVEDPTFNYGREYRREKQKENIQKQHDLQSAAGEVALVAAAIGGLGRTSSDDQSNGDSEGIPSASTKNGASNDGKKAGRSATKTSPAAAVQSAVQLLPWAVVLLVIVVILIAVMR